MNYHFILTCHEDDYAPMVSLLAGMEAHSDFVATDMNALWREHADTEQWGRKPEWEAWHGFVYPGFPQRTLGELLESVDWQKPAMVRGIVLGNGVISSILVLPVLVATLKSERLLNP